MAEQRFAYRTLSTDQQLNQPSIDRECQGGWQLLDAREDPREAGLWLYLFKRPASERDSDARPIRRERWTA